jgi:hypothetical protein
LFRQVCNSSIWEAEAGGSQVKASLDYIVSPCFNKINQKKRREREREGEREREIITFGGLEAWFKL